MTTSIILKFGPDVAPDPTIPIQDHLRKNLGRLPAPVNHKTLFKTVRIVRPGTFFLLFICLFVCIRTHCIFLFFFFLAEKVVFTLASFSHSQVMAFLFPKDVLFCLVTLSFSCRDARTNAL